MTDNIRTKGQLMGKKSSSSLSSTPYDFNSSWDSNSWKHRIPWSPVKSRGN